MYQDHDSAAEVITEQAATLKKEMEARNIYQDNLIELNKVAGHRARSTLVLGKSTLFKHTMNSIERRGTLAEGTDRTYLFCQ